MKTEDSEMKTYVGKLAKQVWLHSALPQSKGRNR